MPTLMETKAKLGKNIGEIQLPVIPLVFLSSGGHIFSHVRPFYERAVSDLDRPIHRSLWV
jgi:hypothetical protein